MKRLLQGAPVVSGPVNVESYREAVNDGDLLTTSHDGYLARFGVVHRRVLMISQDGGRTRRRGHHLAGAGRAHQGRRTDFALRFHLHPAVKASRLSDARGVMLVLPNRDVWTFETLDDKVDLEDSVFLAGNDGPRRTAQIVIRQDSRPRLLGPLEFCPFDDVGRRHQRPAQCHARAELPRLSLLQCSPCAICNLAESC
jgi:uncharacterized heparinase superfamily protein